MASNEKMSSLCVENNVNNSLPTSWGNTKISVALPALQSLEVALKDNRKKYPDKVQALLWAWEQVLNCMNKEFSLSVFEFMHGHTLHLVLRGDWPRLAPVIQTHLQVLLKRCLKYLKLKYANSSSIPRCSSLMSLVSDPWGHSTLCKLIHGEPTTDEEVMEYCETEKGELIKIRLELLIGSKCEDIALNLAGAAVRWMRVPNSGCETNSTPDQRNFFLDVYLTSLCRFKKSHEIIIQLKNLDLKEGLELVKRFGSANWPSNLNGALSSGTSTSRIWRHGSRVAEIAAHTFLASAMVQAPSPLLADLVLEWAKIHGPTLRSAPDTLFDMIKKLLQTAESLEHICMFSGVLVKQVGNRVKPICIEFFVRFITAEMNDLEQLKMKKEQEKQREMEIKLSSGFLKLADLVGSSYLDIYRECVLTGFSLNPSSETLDKIIELAAGNQNESAVTIPAELNLPSNEKTEIKEERSDCANNLANDSITGDAMPNQVILMDENIHPDKHGTGEFTKSDSSETVVKKNECGEIRHFQGIGQEDVKEKKEVPVTPVIPVAPVTPVIPVTPVTPVTSATPVTIESVDDKLLNHMSYTSNFEKDGDALGLSRHLLDDLATVLRHPRYQSLNWDQNWDELKYTCENYLSDYSNFRDASTKELKYLKIDYNQFKDWPEDDRDKYFGIEKGYEKWMIGSEESDEPYSGSASCSQSIDDSDFDSSDSLLRKKPLKRKEIQRRRSDSDSEYEIGKYRNKKKRKKHKKSPSKVIVDSDNGTLDSIKSTNSVLRKKSKKSKDSCRGTLRSKTLMKNAKNISSQLDDTKSNESIVKFSDNYSDSLYSDNENDNNNSSRKKACIDISESYQEMENISSNLLVSENNKTKDSRTNILKTLRTFRKPKPDHKPKIGFSFFNSITDDAFPPQRESSTYAPNLSLSTINSNSHTSSNKVDLSEELDNYFSKNCKYTFCEDEPLNIEAKLKPYLSKLDKNIKAKSNSFDLPLEDKNMVRNTVSDLNSLENLVPSETNATVQVVQVTNHSTINCTNSTVPACQTSSADKPVPQSTSTPAQNSSIQRNTNSTVSTVSQTEISSSIKTQNSSSADSQSSSQIFAASIQNNINAIIESSETQNTSETITLQRAEPVNNQSPLKVQVQSQNAIVIQSEPQPEQKQAVSSNSTANSVSVRPPRSSAFVFVASGDSSNSVTRTSTFSQQQLQQTFLNLANSSLVGTNIDNNTATLFKAEEGKKPENVVQLTVSRDSRLLVAQQLANLKRSDSTVNVVISQPANFTNARIVEAKANTTEAQRINSTMLRLEPGTNVLKARPVVSQGTQNASLPKFQQAFGKTLYQSVTTCPVVSGNMSENKVVNVLNLNQVQIQRDSSALPSCSVVSKGVQTIKDSGGVTPKPDSTESAPIIIKADTSNSQVITTPVPQTISQVKTTHVKTSSIQTSPGVIFTCKRLAVVKEQESPGNSATVKKTDTKILKDPIRLNELLTAALQANAPAQTSASGSNVINVINPLNQTIQISNNSDDASKIKVETPTGATTQRLTIPSIIQKSISTNVRQTVLQPSSYKFKPFQPSDSSQTAVLKLPLSVRSAFLSTISNITQPVSATTSSNTPSTNQNRTGARESLVVRSRVDPNVSSTSMDSSTTLEQVREFESVLEQVTKTSQMKERINVQFHTSQDSSTASNEANSAAFSSVASSQSNAAAVTPSSTTMELQGERVLSFVTQTTSSETGAQKMSSSTPVVVVQSCRRQAASPALSITSQSSSSPIPCSSGKAQKSSKLSKSKIVKTPPVTSPLKVTPAIPKPQQKPQEDEQTTQRIYAILDKYAEQLRNSPELKNKPAPRRRSNPPTNPTQSSKRKKSSQSRSRSNSQQASCSLGLDMSPSSEDVRTMGSEDSSNGVSQLSQVTSSPQSRIDDTPATPSSETSESLDARDSRIQIQVQPQPQSQSVVTSRALIVQDALLNSDSTKILNTQTRQPTVVANASSVSLPTVRLFVTKGPKMYKIQQMVPMVLRPGVTKLSGGIATQSVGTMSGQQAVVLPTNTRSFTFAEATGEQSINLDSTIVNSGISLLQLQSTNSTNTNISTLTATSTAALPALATSVTETNSVPVTSNASTVCHLTLNQSNNSNSPQLLLETNNKETSVWSDISSAQGTKSLFRVKTEPGVFSCQTDLKLGLEASPSPNLLKQDDIRLENSLEGKEESKSSLLEDTGIKKEVKEEVGDARVGTCEETVSWQQYCLSKEDTSQDDKALQTMNQSIADVEHCSAPNATLTLSHAKRKVSTLDNTLFQSTYRRSDRLQTSKRCEGSQQKKAELKSLSEECKDLGVDKPSASDLFPEAELLLDLDPSSQEAEIQLLMNPESNYDNKECGMNFLQGDSAANLKTYARSNAKSKLKRSSSPSSPFLKMCSDSDSPVLGQSELYSSTSEKALTKPDTTSVPSSLDIDSSPQDSSFESQQKIYSQCDSPKSKSSENSTATSSKSRKRVLTRSHRPHRSANVSKSEKCMNSSQSTGSQTPQENSVNGRFDLDSDSVDFKKSLRDLNDDEEKLREHSLDHDYPSLATPTHTHSSSDTVFSSDPQLNTFDNSTNSLFLSSSTQNNFHSQSRLKSGQDQDTDSLWSLLKKSDQGDDLDSDIDKTTTSDTEDPASENELPLSTNGLGKRRIGSGAKTTKSKISKIVKEDLDVASSASSPEVSEGDKVRVSRRSSLRGLVKKPCSCCNGSPEQPKRKNHSHISTSSCSSTSKKSASSKGQSLLKSVLKKR